MELYELSKSMALNSPCGNRSSQGATISTVGRPGDACTRALGAWMVTEPDCAATRRATAGVGVDVTFEFVTTELQLRFTVPVCPEKLSTEIQ
jgi:hypothetical protein